MGYVNKCDGMPATCVFGDPGKNDLDGMRMKSHGHLRLVVHVILLELVHLRNRSILQ